MREELGEPALRLVLDPEQHVGEVRLWVDVVALAHRDERVEDHESARRLLVAEEERKTLPHPVVTAAGGVS